MHLYVHVPFCARRCSYCDFAIAVRRETPSAEYGRALLQEWTKWCVHEIWEWDASGTLDTIYFGGGTPSRLAPGALAALVERFGADRPLGTDAELTLEANPDDVTDATARGWVSAGINRVSLGVQSFSPEALAWMHRTHTVDQVPRAVEVLRAAGVTNLSLDLIYALPETVARDWEGDLDRALALMPEHLSLYGLTVEPRTPLGRWTARGEVTPAPDDRAADEYLLAHARLSASGYEHYEVSNAALPGRRSRHNGAYWRRAPFIGLGPSAHSGWEGRRSWNIREWAAYADAVTHGRATVEAEEHLTPGQIRIEERYLGLRTDAGISRDTVSAALTDRWIAAGWATLGRGAVRLTPEGWLRLDTLVAALT